MIDLIPLCPPAPPDFLSLNDETGKSKSSDITNISDEFIKYITPIIKGNVEVLRDELGMPKYLKR